MIEALGNAVSELRGHPALLAIVLLQIFTMAMIYFVADGNAERTNARELALIQACGDK